MIDEIIELIHASARVEVAKHTARELPDIVRTIIVKELSLSVEQEYKAALGTYFNLSLTLNGQKVGKALRLRIDAPICDGDSYELEIE